MLKKEYYCLVAGLPDLFFNENKTVINCIEFREELCEILNKNDHELIKLIYFPFDNNNLITLIFNIGKPFNKLGYFTSDFLDSQIKKPDKLPEYMIEFINLIKSNEIVEYKPEHENQLATLFFKFLLKVNNQFLNNWFRFELNTKNILAALNCIKYDYNPEDHLIKAGDKYVYELLLSRKFKTENIEEDILFAGQIIKIYESELTIAEKEQAIDKLKWDYLEENTFFHYFTIEKIISYVLKLIITERWLKLDPENGKSLLLKLVDELKTSYTIPSEFSTVK